MITETVSKTIESSFYEQRLLDTCLRREQDPVVRLEIIKRINPDACWETLMILAMTGSDEVVATTALEQLDKVTSIKVRRLAYPIIFQGSKYPSITKQVAESIGALAKVHVL